MQLDQLFAGAITYLNQPGTFNDFDRLTFIRKHGNTLSGGLLDAQKALLIPVFQETKFLSSFARTLSDSAVFDPGYFVNANNHRATPERVALGKMLFYDRILSGNAERTCTIARMPRWKRRLIFTIKAAAPASVSMCRTKHCAVINYT